MKLVSGVSFDLNWVDQLQCVIQFFAIFFLMKEFQLVDEFLSEFHGLIVLLKFRISRGNILISLSKCFMFFRVCWHFQENGVQQLNLLIMFHHFRKIYLDKLIPWENHLPNNDLSREKVVLIVKYRRMLRFLRVEIWLIVENEHHHAQWTVSWRYEFRSHSYQWKLYERSYRYWSKRRIENQIVRYSLHNRKIIITTRVSIYLSIRSFSLTVFS